MARCIRRNMLRLHFHETLENAMETATSCDPDCGTETDVTKMVDCIIRYNKIETYCIFHIII